jgi:hypothetical protein
MLKQKVFFFAAGGESSDRMIGADELRRMAADYVNLYGESCLNDPETPSFVRRLLARKPEAEMPRAG